MAGAVGHHQSAAPARRGPSEGGGGPSAECGRCACGGARGGTQAWPGAPTAACGTWCTGGAYRGTAATGEWGAGPPWPQSPIFGGADGCVAGPQTSRCGCQGVCRAHDQGEGAGSGEAQCAPRHGAAPTWPPTKGAGWCCTIVAWAPQGWGVASGAASAGVSTGVAE